MNSKAGETSSSSVTAIVRFVVPGDAAMSTSGAGRIW
jgi:hypothetical protein